MGSSCSERGEPTQKPSKKQRRTLERATLTYQESLSTAISYLERRGLSEATAIAHRLGVVTSPELGHERFTGRLAIPYLDRLGVYAIKFRCIKDHVCKLESCPKYDAPQGQETSLYGILDTDEIAQTIHITEGELDRLILRQVFDEPAVGVPGVQNWKPHYRFHFQSFDRVLIWPDGDKAGKDLANKLQRELRSLEVIPVPDGMDVTDVYVARGADTLKLMAGNDGEESD